MRSAWIKVVVGCFALLLSLILLWVAERNYHGDYYLAPSSMKWSAFPVLITRRNSSHSAALNNDDNTMVAFIYGPHDCYPNREAMDGWHKAAAIVETAHSFNILTERSATSAERYLSVFPTPYRTRLDSSGWFQDKFELEDTPAVILFSERRPSQVIYPTRSALNNFDRQHIVQEFSRFDTL